MYRFYVNSQVNDKHYGDMLRVFFAEQDFECICIDLPQDADIALGPDSILVNREKSLDRNTIKRELFRLGSKITGIQSDWGILTGVRPLKLALDVLARAGNYDSFRAILKDEYLMGDSRIDLLIEIIEYQQKHVDVPDPDLSALYIGIPFCPTRCAYCAFASDVAACENDIEIYFDNLLKEIDYAGKLADVNGTKLESVYIGGGTPTTLDETKLGLLIDAVKTAYNINPEEIEFTIEAGRPDTITAPKLDAIRSRGVSRISINPQSMHDRTLKLIGRSHTVDATRESYGLASEYDFGCINADLIAGLQEETLDDFVSSLDEIIDIGADNITVHTLSVKRGSRLRDDDPGYYRRNTELVTMMLDEAHRILIENGYHPYYIYRQKHQMGALENVGYCRENAHSIYNIRIMEEKQTIIALGAGGIGKVYDPVRGSLTRIPNVSNYKVYNERIDEMIARKDRYCKL